MADGEYFYYIGDDKPPERFASKRRIRRGLGYRHSYEWRFEVLAMRDEAKETLDDAIDVDAYMLDLRIKWFLSHIWRNTSSMICPHTIKRFKP
jgi:hypothetical protein